MEGAFFMPGQKRVKTKYPGVYFNETTKKYDVKYNFKVYNPLTQKNDYKQKWSYNFMTLSEARSELAKLQSGGIKPEDKDITLQGAFELWKLKADTQNFSPVTIANTEDHMKMIYQFIHKDTKLKDITEEVYLQFCSDIKSHGYADETLHSMNATFRKLINLCYKKKLIKENILDYSDNLRTKKKEEYRLVEHEEFMQLQSYFRDNKFIRLGINNYPIYRFLVYLLYYTGMRIGEALALTFLDFEEFDYYRKNDPNKPKVRLVPSESDMGEHLQGMRVRVTKAYVSEIKLTKDPKNYKKRTIPIPGYVERLYYIEREKHLQRGGSLDDRVFNFTHGAASTMIKNACKKIGIPIINCHDFRHTYISNLISHNIPLPIIEKCSGDTQNTILLRYSHMFESDETLVLMALDDL